VALNYSGSAVDDPDVTLLEAQSREVDQKKRQQMVWEIDRLLQEDVAHPIISDQLAAGCWQPWVKNYTIQVNSLYNGWRFEDIWLDR
jgi:peptide/nickel transport system substrate-binding protein